MNGKENKFHIFNDLFLIKIRRRNATVFDYLFEMNVENFTIRLKNIIYGWFLYQFE